MSETGYVAQGKALAEAQAEIEQLRSAWSAQDDEICQTLGAALGFPRYCDDLATFPDATESDGVCVGMYTAATMAFYAAGEILRLRAAIGAGEGITVTVERSGEAA